MATTERDYYELLGVSRGASDAEIKRAFRALARELHPDVSVAPDADGRFREVAEAYEVLSDPDRRATYDRFGHAGLRRGGFHPTFTDFGSIADVFAAFFGDDPFGMGAAASRQSTRGGDLQVVVEIDLEEAFTGISTTVPMASARHGANMSSNTNAVSRCSRYGPSSAVGRYTSPTRKAPPAAERSAASGAARPGIQWLELRWSRAATSAGCGNGNGSVRGGSSAFRGVWPRTS